MKPKATRAEEDSSPAGRPGGEDLVGRELAGCRVLKRLGQGAMGTVYLAEQKSLRRRVALKVLDPKYSRDLVYIERFEREAQACAQLVHFNVVQVYDFGRAGETYYIVSEFVEGTTVQDRLDEEEVLGCEEAAALVLQAAEGLAAAQEAGIVHRDIKPENLMITVDGVLKIADFGLAKAVQDDASVTHSGMIVGTPFYMSPEQAKGQPLDGRSDLYSLGVTWFHMVTGRIPFDGESVISVLLQHISGERPNPAEINPAVPQIVADVILRLMNRDAEDRYATAEELVPDLQRLLDRLRRGDIGEEAVADVDAERRKRYKRLRRTLVARLQQRQVPPAVKARMEQGLTSDAGVFVETNEVYPEGSVVEVRFSVPGRPGLVQGVGLVRWAVPKGAHAGMGVTFLKVTPVSGPAPQASRTSVARRATMKPKEVVRVLTETPLHQRLLKYYYANLGRAVTLKNIASTLGVGTRMVESRLEAYQNLGLAVDKGDAGITFIWPDDRDLQNAIVDWIEEYGLK